MRKIITAVLLVGMLLCHVIPGSAEEAQKYSVTNGSHSLDAQRPVLGNSQLVENAQSAILYEVNTDTLMYAENADEKLQPSSMLKMLTALIAVEEGELSDKITVSESVLSAVPSDAKKTKFIAGEILTLEDLLYCMMVDSGNDAAALIAVHIAGSIPAFVEKLNTYASELGCTNSYFTNVHGLPDEAQYTTARDVARILAAAVKNETFCEIFGAINYTVPANGVSEARMLASGNYLMNNTDNSVKIYYDSRVIGGRTGVYNDGSRCISSLAEDNGMRMICVIMGAKSEYSANGSKVTVYGGYTETSDLLTLGFDDFRSRQLIYSGQVLLQRPVQNGDCWVNLGTKEAAGAVLPKGVTMENISVEFNHVSEILQAPIAVDQVLTTARYMYNGDCVAEVDLYSLNAVAEVGKTLVETTNSTSRNGMSTGMKLLVVLIVILLCYMLWRIYVLKLSKNGRKKKRSR